MNVEERHTAVSLWVDIDKERTETLGREGGRKIYGGRCLADTALLVRYRNDHG